MKYKHKMNRIKTSTGRKWFKRTLKRSERAKAQEEVKGQIDELSANLFNPFVVAR